MSQKGVATRDDSLHRMDPDVGEPPLTGMRIGSSPFDTGPQIADLAL